MTNARELIARDIEGSGASLNDSFRCLFLKVGEELACICHMRRGT
jgi:hypothetical protein